MKNTYSSNRITIAASALQGNFQILSSRVGDKCQMAAVVKANAYGLGVDIAVPALEQAGAKFFYVAHFDEALEVRKITSLPIAVLGGLPHGAGDDFKHHKIIPVLNSAEDIENCPADLPAIWHIDTGMNRLGLNTEDVANLASHAKSLPLLMMTHFTSSDDLESQNTAAQVARFDDCIAGLPKPFQITPQSICNSSGIFRGGWHRQQVRAGIALYGGNPTPETTNPMNAVVSLDARILQIRHAKTGETIGYNQTATLARDTILATVGIGYADGFLRSGSGHTKLYWNSHPCPVMGRVSMDLVVVDIGNLPASCPPPAQGDWLEVLGKTQSVDTLAADMGTIGYEVLTSLSRRAKQVLK